MLGKLLEGLVERHPLLAHEPLDAFAGLLAGVVVHRLFLFLWGRPIGLANRAIGDSAELIVDHAGQKDATGIDGAPRNRARG
jgi:hypothetical protein